MGKRFSIITLVWLSLFNARAQEIIPRIEFQGDSVKIGEAINLSLWVQYPLHKQIVLPDSNFSYLPFEFESKQYFPTRADSVFAYDSVVYQFSTFEIDPVQKLQVPIFLLASGDSIELLSNFDSVYLQEMIKVLPDSLDFKENVAFVPTTTLINFTYLSIGLGIFLIIFGVVWLVFGDKIRSHFKLYRLKKEYEKFTQKLETGIGNIRRNESNHQLVEEVLVHWKKYMEGLEDRPFTKYTSKEIVKAGYGETLRDILKNIDSAIYGNVSQDKMHENFEALEDYTLERYMLKVKEVQNG